MTDKHMSEASDDDLIEAIRQRPGVAWGATNIFRLVRIIDLLRKEKADLKAELSDADTRAELMGARIAELEAELKSTKECICVTPRIKELEAEKETKQTQIYKQTDHIIELEKKVCVLEAEVKRKDELIHARERVIKAMNKELDYWHNSPWPGPEKDAPAPEPKAKRVSKPECTKCDYSPCGYIYGYDCPGFRPKPQEKPSEKCPPCVECAKYKTCRPIRDYKTGVCSNFKPKAPKPDKKPARQCDKCDRTIWRDACVDPNGNYVLKSVCLSHTPKAPKLDIPDPPLGDEETERVLRKEGYGKKPSKKVN